ncbi:MAG: cysteine hydrolase family protein [Candidatus Scalinduaceae bacterium]
MKNKTVFVDIDTQFDFMNSGGALYVPNAEDIIDNVGKLFDYAKEHKIKILSSIDAHEIDDPEFQNFPSHCVKDTPGNQKMETTIYKDSIVIENKRQHISETVLNHKQIIVEKQSFDIFDNINVDKIIINLDASDYVVFGVATDYCIKASVLGLIRRGYNVSLVTDAVKAITREGEKEALKEMKGAGVIFTSTQDVVEREL